jgi:hypothetical protein
MRVTRHLGEEQAILAANPSRLRALESHANHEETNCLAFAVKHLAAQNLF